MKDARLHRIFITTISLFVCVRRYRLSVNAAVDFILHPFFYCVFVEVVTFSEKSISVSYSIIFHILLLLLILILLMLLLLILLILIVILLLLILLILLITTFVLHPTN